MRFYKFYLILWYFFYKYYFFLKLIIINYVIIISKKNFLKNIYYINFFIFKRNIKLYFSFWNYFYYGNKTYPTIFEDVYVSLVLKKVIRYRVGYRNRLQNFFEKKILKFSTKQSYVVFPEYEHYWYFTYRIKYWRMQLFFLVLKFYTIYLLIFFFKKNIKNNNIQLYLKMLRKIYFLMIIKILKKNLINDVKFIKLKFNKNEKKIFLNFFFNLKTNVLTSFFFFNNNKTKLLSYYTLKRLASLRNKINYKKDSLFFFQLKLNNLSYDIKSFDEIFLIYLNFFISKGVYSSSLYNKFYFNLYLEKKKVLVLSQFFLKKNFIKIIKFLINGSFLNFKPLVVFDENLNESSELINNYLKFLSKSDKYDYIFICNPFIKIKFISQLKKLNLPIISVVDNSINQSWIDYPIYIDRINSFSTYFFYCFFFQIFTMGQNLKKKYYENLYKDYLTFNISKEYILKNELK